MLFGGAFAVYEGRNAIYQSTIAFTVKNLSPFYDTNYAFLDFRELFRLASASEFEAWRASNSKARIEFSNVALTQVVDGVELTSYSNLRSLDTNGLRVNANDLQLLDGFHSYLSLVNESLNRQYIERMVDEINYIEHRFKDFWATDVALRDQVLIFMQHTNEVRNLTRYVERAEGGAHVFEISRPMPPVVTSAAPTKNLIVALSIVLGGFVGAA
jgi:hypothetical protein